MKELSIEQIEAIAKKMADGVPEIGRPFYIYNGMGRLSTVAAVRTGEWNFFLPIGDNPVVANLYSSNEFIYLDDYINSLAGGAE